MRLNVNQLSLILASQSPRRKDLLGMLNLPFQIKVSHCEEISEETNPQSLAIDLALQKAHASRENLNLGQGHLIVGSDTVVELENRIYGKPKNREEAEKFLKELAGKTHQVTTGVALVFPEEEDVSVHTFSVATKVTFTEISSFLLEHYLKTNEWADKAGAYGIQASALSFIKEIRGSYSNVVGFPLAEFVEELKSFLGVESLDQVKWT